jgi:predicted dehydrogenase
MDKYRAALIGTGRIGFSLQNDRLREQPASHAAALAGHPRVTLVAGCDIDPTALAAFHKKYPRTCAYSDAAMLMREEKPDIVSVAVEEGGHLPIMKEICPFRPRLVILEKPVAPNLVDARRIIEVSRRFRVPVCVNHERRFSRDYLTAKNLLHQGAIGTLHPPVSPGKGTEDAADRFPVEKQKRGNRFALLSFLRGQGACQHRALR